MTTKEKQCEIRGRLYLWHQAISECISIFQLINRNEEEQKSGRPIERSQYFSEALHEFSKQQPDYQPERQLLSHFVTFQKIQNEEYPSSIDCLKIDDYCKMLVIVFFCQLFNPGNCDKGKVAKNTKNFVQTHLDQILSTIFATDEEKEKFSQFSETCLKARDKMIGHADGSAFNVRHGHPVTSMNLVHVALLDINFTYMESVLER